MGNYRSSGKVKSFGVYSCMTNSILIFECDFIFGSFLLFGAVMGNFWSGGRIPDKVQKPFSNTCS